MDKQRPGIRLVQDMPTDDGIPLLGVIAAGRPIEAAPQPKSIQAPPQLRTDRPRYAFEVRRDSVCEAGILDGDYVVIEQRETARNGEIIVALVRGEEVNTLKRIVQEPGRIGEPGGTANTPS